MVGDLNQTMPYSGWKRIVVVQESTMVDLREMLVVGSKTNSWAKSMTRAVYRQWWGCDTIIDFSIGKDLILIPQDSM